MSTSFRRFPIVLVPQRLYVKLSTTYRQTDDGSCYLSEEKRKMAYIPFKLVRYPGRLDRPANYLGGFRDV